MLICGVQWIIIQQELEDDEIETERIPWALKAKRELLKDMKKCEIERQENIRELVYTERTHLQKLKIMKYVSVSLAVFLPSSLSLSCSVFLSLSKILILCLQHTMLHVCAFL